jgi:hypothetical protein
MKLYVNIEKPVSDIQKQFNAFYPFLKLEFFRSHSNSQSILKNDPVASNEFLKHQLSLDTIETINVDCKRTVADVENDLKKQFGATTQIFRRSGNVWIETTLTDDWTLEKQNKEGEQISKHFVVKGSKKL